MKSSAQDPTTISAHLYHAQLCGGPGDGYKWHSDDLPETCFQLPLGPASYSTPGAAPRVARYELAPMQLVMSGNVPTVICRYEYRGTVAISPAPRSLWWKRHLDGLRRLLKPRPIFSGRHLTHRSYVGVQD
jgi:hypothetical protein